MIEWTGALKMKAIHYNAADIRAFYRLTDRFVTAGTKRIILKQKRDECKKADRLVPSHVKGRKHIIALARRAALNLQMINTRESIGGRELLIGALRGNMPLIGRECFKMNVPLPKNDEKAQPKQAGPTKPREAVQLSIFFDRI